MVLFMHTLHSSYTNYKPILKLLKYFQQIYYNVCRTLGALVKALTFNLVMCDAAKKIIINACTATTHIYKYPHHINNIFKIKKKIKNNNLNYI